MPYYPIVDLASMEPEDSGGGYKTNLLTLGGEAGTILPVFTSINRFWAFVDVYLAGDDSLEPSTFPIDPFRLAEKIEPSIETGELGFLVFNPTAVSPGQWSIERKPIPKAHYCRCAMKAPEIRLYEGDRSARSLSEPLLSALAPRRLAVSRPRTWRLEK
jgi:hypothetical protein